MSNAEKPREWTLGYGAGLMNNGYAEDVLLDGDPPQLLPGEQCVVIEKSAYDSVVKERAGRVKPETYGFALKQMERFMRGRDALAAQLETMEREYRHADALRYSAEAQLAEANELRLKEAKNAVDCIQRLERALAYAKEELKYQDFQKTLYEIEQLELGE